MRFLKRKIRLKQEAPDLCEIEDKTKKIAPIKVEEGSEIESTETPLVEEVLLPIRNKRRTLTNVEGDSKNIIKNYGKILCSFAASKIAIPYLESYLTKKDNQDIKIQEFMDYIKNEKNSVNSMESLRRILIINDQDGRQMKVYKEMFKEISIIFLKYFAVNWIFNGKLLHKKAHLKFRFKMLRRIRAPEHFTYLKTSANK